MEDFGKVGLGFAEFVSQLLHETFDATLSAQNYQAEKLLELEKALGYSPARFQEVFVSDEALDEKETELFGSSLVANMTVGPALLQTISGLFEDFSSIVVNKKLTVFGYETLRQMVLEAVVSEKKDRLRLLLNKSEMAQIVVESGEIKAKLDLSVVSKTLAPAALAPAERLAQTGAAEGVQETRLASTIFQVGDKRVREIKDTDTNRRVLLVEKSALANESVKTTAALPDTRIVAMPLTTATTGQLYSEITIRFKTK